MWANGLDMTPGLVIATRFGRTSTAAEVVADVDLGGRRAVVTGAASGIGVETARALASSGAEVTLAVRDAAAGQRVAASIGPTVRVAALDLSSPSSVAAFVAAWDGPLDMLVNNAGVMGVPSLQLTASGCELHFATNHLGHFALALGLYRALASSGSARVVSLTSTAHFRSPVVFDDLFYTFRPYDPISAYGQSKTANALFVVEATRRWAADGITVNAAMPGGILTPLQRHMPSDYAQQAIDRYGEGVFKTVQQGAATSVLCAASPLLDGISGRYFEDCNEAPVLLSAAQSDGMHGVAPFSLDPANAERLWDVSERLLAGP
ncbi:MAG: dehydrogenase, short-chain alcohol dehydrogenase like protein [Ilumatobacteraceae bacterium]|nr:dehydrogenase, short-chain alcohol dehydrogenase like protein [Ilumatobacteraceae bacterium]